MFELPTGDVYQLHVRLAYIEPPIWRRIVVSGQISLFRLHRMLQVVMGWENYHLHQFIVGAIRYGEPDPEYGLEMKDDRRVRLQKIAREKGTSFIYEYDFGDGWRHVITVERIEPWTQDMYVPRCLDGARACPPEDCGGIGGYEHLLTALQDPRHPDHKEMRAWAGTHFNPELFSLQAVNSALAIL
jgi:Plasmid pRiA4b ORF-3-like protein